MVGTNVKMIAIRMVRSKLRKREENGVRQDHVILHSAQQNNNHCHHNNNSSGVATAPATANGGTTIPTVSATVICPPPVPSPTDATLAANGNNSTPRQFLWQIPPTHASVLYSNDRDTLVHRQLPLEQPGFCRGFRKSLQGRWKRLVKKKPINETYAIPPELRDQLKNIYVY